MEEKKYGFSKTLCLNQMTEATEVKRLLKYLIKENSADDEQWVHGLMPLLCEYFTVANQYTEVLVELLFNPIRANDHTGEDEYVLTSKQAALLQSHAALMQVNDYDLISKYNISLTVH